MRRVCRYFGSLLAAYLTRPSGSPSLNPPGDPERLRAALRPSDALLVDGIARFSTAIIYLTQSTWSHVAIYVGGVLGRDEDGETLCRQSSICTIGKALGSALTSLVKRKLSTLAMPVLAIPKPRTDSWLWNRRAICSLVSEASGLRMRTGAPRVISP